ncbi:MAG: ATP-binding protein [Desulfobulbales bacterium]|nr:ATP-binding protein [Desulfobulbales bacterium]
MVLTLRRTSYIAAVFVALILGFLLLLGSRQYRAHKEYEKVINQNEKIIFQFATIREHITESLLESRYQQLINITGEIENLNLNISQILQQPIIPDEYRISFAGQVDFAGITLLLRSIGAGDQAQAKIRQLNQEIRILGERLMLFDRVIATHVKRKLVGFQNFVIGLLAIILFIVIYILLFWQNQIAMPLMDLVKQAKEVISGKRSTIAVRKKRGEVAELAAALKNIMAQQDRMASEFSRHNRMLEMVHSVGESVWQAESRDAVFSEACRSVLANSDYVLAWIGIPDKDNKILPVIADASTTMSRQERDECMAALLSASEENSEKYDAANKALLQKTPIVLPDVLADLPKGPFKNTPFATSKPDCIALPLLYDEQIFGVMNIYSIATGGFNEEEIGLLNGMCREIVFALVALAARESDMTLARLQAARKEVFESSADPILVVTTDGTIVEANPAAAAKFGGNSSTIVDSAIHDIFTGTTPSYKELVAALNGGGANASLEIKHADTEYRVDVSPLQNLTGETDTYLLIARDISEQRLHKAETLKASKLAAVGELSVGVANEINNLTNGIINYTQILSEEIAASPVGNEQSLQLLNNVIEEGERISKIIQQLLFFNANHSRTKEAVKINKIIEDSLALTKHQFRYDAIDVSLRLPATLPSVKVNVQEMQCIFLNLLSNARYALNQRFSGKNPQKRIAIDGEISSRNGQQRIKVTCTDYGVGIHPNIMNKVIEPFFSTKPEGVGTGLGLSICRSIMEDYNGTLAIESTPNDHTSIIMELPSA